VRPTADPYACLERCKLGEPQQLVGLGSGGDQSHGAAVRGEGRGGAQPLPRLSARLKRRGDVKGWIIWWGTTCKDCRQPSDARTNSGPGETVEVC
jgi:hypothetical protein